MKKRKRVFTLENNPAESLSLDCFLLTNSDVNIFTADKMDYFTKTETETRKTL